MRLTPLGLSILLVPFPLVELCSKCHLSSHEPDQSLQSVQSNVKSNICGYSMEPPNKGRFGASVLCIEVSFIWRFNSICLGHCEL